MINNDSFARWKKQQSGEWDPLEDEVRDFNSTIKNLHAKHAQEARAGTLKVGATRTDFAVRTR